VASSVPFTLLGHLPTVSVRVDDARTARFWVDTGVGVTVVARSLLEELGHPPLGRTHVGRRMSGQALAVPLSQVDSLTLESHRASRPTVGIFDLASFATAGESVDGLLSLGFFEPTPFTLDYARSTLTLEDERSLSDRRLAGAPVPVQVERNGPEVNAFLDLLLPSGRRARVEVDTGSDRLILDERYMPELGLARDSPGVSERRGTDETGHEYVRYFGRMSGEVRALGDARVRQVDVPVMFQKIIHDGLVGRDFLARSAVTYDVARSELIFSLPTEAPPRSTP
jgi:predicted aspartyl protease